MQDNNNLGRNQIKQKIKELTYSFEKQKESPWDTNTKFTASVPSLASTGSGVRVECYLFADFVIMRNI